MRRNSSNTIEKWFIYFRPAFVKPSFTLSLTSGTGVVVCEGVGEHKRTSTGGYAITIDGFGRKTDLVVEFRESTPDGIRAEDGTQILAGCWKIDGIEVGNAVLMDGYTKPVFELLVSRPLKYRLQVFRSNREPVCPLVVEGFDGYEMVLGHYSDLLKEERSSLPQSRPKRDFVALLKAIRYIAPDARPRLEAIGTIVAAAVLIISQEYLRSTTS